MAKQHTYTVIGYLYRDGGNYKSYGYVALAGVFTDRQRKAITRTLDEGLYFIPGQVGMPELQAKLGAIDPDADHVWHEWDWESVRVERASRDELARRATVLGATIIDLARRFADVGRWDVSAACRRTGLVLAL